MQNQISAYPYFRVGLKSKRSVHHLLLETKPELRQVYTYVSVSVSTSIYSYVRATFITYICSYQKLEDKNTLYPAVNNNRLAAE